MEKPRVDNNMHLPKLATTETCETDKTGKTDNEDALCSMVTGDVYKWMQRRVMPVHAKESHQGVDSLVYFGRCVMPAGSQYQDA